jgi:hypothetical protein
MDTSTEIIGLDENINNGEYILSYIDLEPMIIKKIKIGTSFITNDINKSISRFFTDIITNDTTVIHSIDDDPNNNAISIQHTIMDKIPCDEKCKIYAFEFIIDYMNEYYNGNEPMPPQKPAIQKNMTTWIESGNETYIFSKFMNIYTLMDDASTFERAKFLWKQLNCIIMLANYLEMSNLIAKCCALMAWILRGKEPELIQQLYK